MPKNNQNARRRKQRESSHINQYHIDFAEKNGLIPARRTIHEDSHGVYANLASQIYIPHVQLDNHRNTAREAHLTLAGIRHYSPYILMKGPSLEKILDRAPSTRHDLKVQIGKFVVFGSHDKKPKFGFAVDSESLEEEFYSIVDSFAHQGMKLDYDNGRHNPHGYFPHITFSHGTPETTGYFLQTKVQQRINAVVKDLGQDAYFNLNPVTLPPPQN